MGQKVNPVGFRVGVIRQWDSIWWNEKSLGNWVVEDESIRRFIEKKFRKAEVASIKIERSVGVIRVIIRTGKPAFLIGQKGNEIDLLKKELEKIVEDKNSKIDIKIEEVRKISFSAKILACNLALQIERNFPYKRAMKKIMADVQRDGIKGIKIKVSGRLGGAEMAREEWYAEGRIPTQTLRADIDYATDTAHTKYGCIGVKVWLFRGEIIDKNSRVDSTVSTSWDRDNQRSDRPPRKDFVPRKGAEDSQGVVGTKRPRTNRESAIIKKNESSKGE